MEAHFCVQGWHSIPFPDFFVQFALEANENRLYLLLSFG